MEKRFLRQTSLKEIGEEGQKRLMKTSVAVVGAGALGSVVCELLVRAGIRKFFVVDFDRVEISNLQRQALFTEEDVGRLKVEVIKSHLIKIDKKTNIKIFSKTLDEKNVNMLSNYDIIIDCTDNITTRLILNKFAWRNNIPLVIGAAAGVKGFIYNVVRRKERGCYACIFNTKIGESCRDVGVLNSLTYIIGSLQVTEAIKIILGKEFMKELLFIDVWHHRYERYNIKKNRRCKVCK